MRFAPFFLDPSTPPEGKPRHQRTQPGDPPSYLEERGTSLGLTFTRGRTWTSNSHLALEAGEFAADRYPAVEFLRPMFKAYFEDLEEIGTIDMLVRIGGGAGLPGDELRQALETGIYRQQVDDGIAWSHSIGVTAVPTFVFDQRFGIVGAQDFAVFADMMRRLGRSPKP